MAMCQGGFLVLLVLLVLQVLLVLLVLLVLGPLVVFLWARSFAIANLNQQNLQDQKAPVAPAYTHEHLMYALFYTALTTIHTVNGIPSPSFPFPLQHLSWISYSMHCSPIRSPQQPTCHLHIGTAHPRPSLTRLMRPLCATPSPLPASAIIPQRPHPRDRPSHQYEPPAHARPHADLCLALAGATRYIRRGPYPDLAALPPGRHACTLQNRHLRYCARFEIGCCLFAWSIPAEYRHRPTPPPDADPCDRDA